MAHLPLDVVRLTFLVLKLTISSVENQTKEQGEPVEIHVALTGHKWLSQLCRSSLLVEDVRQELSCSPVSL